MLQWLDTDTHTYIYIHTYTHTYTYTCTHTFIHTCIHLNRYIYIFHLSSSSQIPTEGADRQHRNGPTDQGHRGCPENGCGKGALEMEMAMDGLRCVALRYVTLHTLYNV